ncbi:MAG: hypothetical protein JSV27_05770 [Candidatus Bathyarchaeota archaeon]|nr:MAG: hypothetical protein JSV27_05770 [Candidatus Bathyarchaeota archaeon]
MFKRVKAFLVPLTLAAVLAAGLNPLGLASAADSQYDNHITFQILPDESIVIRAQGSFTQERYQWGFSDLVRNYQMLLDLETATEGRTDISFDLSLEMRPEEASELANLELEVESQGDSTSQVVYIHVDYPGYIALDGTLESNLVEPPFTGTIDLSVSATLYYVIYPQEEIEQMLMMFPLMETMLASQVAENSDGELSLSRLELVSSEMGPVSTTFAIEASIGGDFQKGIRAAMDNMGLVYTEEGYDFGEISVVEVESYSSSLVYVKDSFTFEASSEATVVGDVDEQLNVLKESMLTEVLQEGSLDDEDVAMINEFLWPTVFSVRDLHFEADYEATDGTVNSGFDLRDLGMVPPSLNAFTEFLQYLTEESPPEDFMLILEGGSIGGESVVISSPAGSNPVSEEADRVVWEFDNAESLDQVSLDVTSSEPGSGSIVMIAAVVGLAVVGAAAFFFLRKK